MPVGTQDSNDQGRLLFGRLLRLHGLRYLFALVSAAYFACTALVIFSLSFRASWGSLGSLFAAPGALLAALGHSWAALGRSWAALGRSWEALGRLLAALGLLLAALEAILERRTKICKTSMPKMTDLGSQKGAKREPKSNPKRTKIEDKNRCEKTPIQDRLEAALGRSWAILEAILRSKKCQKSFVLNGFVKNLVF